MEYSGSEVQREYSTVQHYLQVKQLRDNIKAAILLDPVQKAKKLYESEVNRIRDQTG